MRVTMYHNPKCSKSRETLALLVARGLEPRVVEYLKTPPTAQELEAILDKLGLEPRALLRTKEPAYVAAGLQDPRLTRAELVAGMIRYPSVIERPIVVHGARAAIGRPPEKVLEILD
jgi:arsenate reductase